MIFVSTPRLLQIGVMYTIMVILFLFLGMKVLKRGKAITNRFMGTYFMWMGITMSLNVLYVIVDNAELTATLANLVGVSIMFAQVFLVLFILIIRHSQAEINKKKQILWILIAGLLAVGLFLVGSLGLGATYGVNLQGDNVPVWLWYYALYNFCASLFLSGYVFYNSYVARKSFADATMKKRFTYFLIGIVLLIILMCMNPWSNLEPSSTFRTFYGLYAIVVIPCAFLLYMSLGKEVAKTE